MSASEVRPMDCVACGGGCCKHIALEIDKPTSKQEYDNIRWYLVHKNVSVTVDHDNEWLLVFHTPCERLDENYRCTHYDERPRICKDYPSKDNYCEYQTDEPTFKREFNTVEEFEAWLDKKKKKWRFKK